MSAIFETFRKSLETKMRRKMSSPYYYMKQKPRRSQKLPLKNYKWAKCRRKQENDQNNVDRSYNKEVLKRMKKVMKVTQAIKRRKLQLLRNIIRNQCQYSLIQGIIQGKIMGKRGPCRRKISAEESVNMVWNNLTRIISSWCEQSHDCQHRKRIGT